VRGPKGPNIALIIAVDRERFVKLPFEHTPPK